LARVCGEAAAAAGDKVYGGWERSTGGLTQGHDAAKASMQGEHARRAHKASIQGEHGGWNASARVLGH